MDSVSQKVSDGPTAKTGPDPRAPEALQAKPVEVWAFLCPSPLCNTELIIFPEQTGQWVECPSCGLQLRAPEVIPGKDDPIGVEQRPARRRKARASADEVAWLALQAAAKAGWPAEPKPPADDPGTSARDALAREVTRASVARTEPETAEPEPAAPEIAQVAHALDSLARGPREDAETPPAEKDEPHAPEAAEELKFHDESVPLPESALRETIPVPLEREPMAEPVVREKPAFQARPVAPPVRPGRRATAGRPNAPWEIGSAKDTRAASLNLPTPAVGPPLGRPIRKVRSNLLVVWVIAVVTATGVGLLAWVTALPDLAAGSILAIGVAVLWTFFGRGSDEPGPQAGAPW